MRKEFAKLLLEEMRKEPRIVLLTADMGYGLWDNIRIEFKNQRFFNFGASEQLMVGAAVGMALEGKIPVCYSITPFVLYRPFEFIRNYMNYEKIPVKLVGGGRDKDYGYLGYTHWAEDDIEILNALENISLFKPKTEEALNMEFYEFLYAKYPCYMNLKK